MMFFNIFLLFVCSFSKEVLIEQNLELQQQNRALLNALKALTQIEEAVAQGEESISASGGRVRIVSTETGEPLQLGGVNIKGHLQLMTDDGWAYLTSSVSFGWEGAELACKELGYDIIAHPVQEQYNPVPRVNNFNPPVTKYVSADCSGATNSLAECDVMSSRGGAVKQECTKLTYCPDNANFNTNDYHVKYWFELNGNNGQEQVKVSTGPGYERNNYLSKEPKALYSYCYVEIEFTNDTTGRDVFFKPLGAQWRNQPAEYIPVGASIKLKENWSQWRCGSSNENYRCQDVRSGKFYWRGTYQITFNTRDNPHWRGYGSYDN